MSEGMEMPGAPRALRKQGRRSSAGFTSGCLKCESDVRSCSGPNGSERSGETNPRNEPKACVRIALVLTRRSIFSSKEDSWPRDQVGGDV